MNYTRRLALFEEVKGLPWAAVWDYYCLTEEVPTGMKWLDRVVKYEKEVQCVRGSSQEASLGV